MACTGPGAMHHSQSPVPRRHSRRGAPVASYETGVLTLRIPVAESAKPRKVQITEGADERTIEGQTTQAGA
jgi:hypothetical protein